MSAHIVSITSAIEQQLVVAELLWSRSAGGSHYDDDSEKRSATTVTYTNQSKPIRVASMRRVL